MLHIFENTDRLVSKKGEHKGEVTPYINVSTSGRPVAIDDGDQMMFETLSKYGTPVPVPDGLDVTVVCSNAFLLSVLG